MKPFIEPYTGLVGRANAVSAPMEQVFEKYQTMCSQGMSDRAIAEALGVNSGLVTRLRYEQPEQWFSQTLIQAFLGQEWGIVRVAFRWPEDTPDEHFPDLLLAPSRRAAARLPTAFSGRPTAARSISLTCPRP